jgi:hypothetical protein
LVLADFGLITLFLGSSVVFNLFGVRSKQGNYVLLVVWANFISSIFYLFAAYGSIKTQKWTIHLLVFSFILLLITFIGLIFHINSGGLYENKSIGAMIFRITLNLVFSILAYFTLSYFERIFKAKMSF